MVILHSSLASRHYLRADGCSPPPSLGGNAFRNGKGALSDDGNVGLGFEYCLYHNPTG